MRYSVKIGEQNYSVEIEDLDARPVLVKVDGERMEVWPEEEATVITQPAVDVKPATKEPSNIPCPSPLLPQTGISPKAVTAPIPGVIVEIKVSAGQTVNRGDELCVLEAMKMKNSIKAVRGGVIASININTGDQVRHGQVLLEFAD